MKKRERELSSEQKKESWGALETPASLQVAWKKNSMKKDSADFRIEPDISPERKHEILTKWMDKAHRQEASNRKAQKELHDKKLSMKKPAAKVQPAAKVAKKATKKAKKKPMKKATEKAKKKPSSKSF